MLPKIRYVHQNTLKHDPSKIKMQYIIHIQHQPLYTNDCTENEKQSEPLISHV